MCMCMCKWFLPPDTEQWGAQRAATSPVDTCMPSMSNQTIRPNKGLGCAAADARCVRAGKGWGGFLKAMGKYKYKGHKRYKCKGRKGGKWQW